MFTYEDDYGSFQNIAFLKLVVKSRHNMKNTGTSEYVFKIIFLPKSMSKTGKGE